MTFSYFLGGGEKWSPSRIMYTTQVAAGGGGRRRLPGPGVAGGRCCCCWWRAPERVINLAMWLANGAAGMVAVILMVGPS